MKRNDAESRIQKKAVAELRTAFIRRGMAEPFPICHAANESDVPVQYRSHLKAMGLAPGFPDLLIALPCAVPPRVGAAIELKAAGARTKPDHRRRQQVWLEYWHACGFFVAICTGHIETAQTLARCGYIPSTAAEAWIRWAKQTDPGNL